MNKSMKGEIDCIYGISGLKVILDESIPEGEIHLINKND
jgi:hypothetical protein